MPTYEVKDPSGMIFDVNAPDGATEQDAIKYVQDNYSSLMGSNYKGMARRAAVENDLDPDLFSRLVEVESSWNPTAKSPKGALGLSQLKPGTAKELGVDPADPWQNLQGGAKYLRKLMDMYNGDYALAVAAYNAGPGNVSIEKRVPNFPETRNHVAKVLNGYTPPGQQEKSIYPDGVKTPVQPAIDYGFNEVTGEPTSPEFGFTKQNTINALTGAVNGAGSLLSTAAYPFDMINDLLEDKPIGTFNKQRRKDLEMGAQSVGAEPESLVYQGSKLGTEIYGTSGVPRLIAGGMRTIPGVSKFPTIANAVESGGMTLGKTPINLPGRVGSRIVGGAVAGGASAGAVDPEFAPAGAAVGGAIPFAAGVAGDAGSGIRNAVFGEGVSSRVRALANTAKNKWGIDIPVDRLVDTPILNSTSNSLKYIPFSGRNAAEDAMNRQLKTALSKTVGENTDNVADALVNAETRLGQHFDDVLKNNKVVVDQQFVEEVNSLRAEVQAELGKNDREIIENQIKDIAGKIQAGAIDGQAAYNIKKTLDRIGKRNSNESFYAEELKKSLLGTLNRSLSEEEAIAFSLTRQQYGNMKELEKVILNGAEGDVAIGAFANKKFHKSKKDLRELAAIARQFVRQREGAHSAQQRVFAGGLGALMTGAGFFNPAAWGAAAGTVGAARGANAVLNSPRMKRAVLEGLLSNGSPSLIQEALPVVYQGPSLLSTN